MLKRISIAIATLMTLAVGLFVATPAQAATGLQTTLACVSGGSQFNLVETYDVSGGVVTLRKHTWTSTPAAQFDRITFTILNGAGDTNLMYAMGGTSSTQNDVPSSGSSTAENGAFSTVFAGGGPKFRMSVYGGVGNSTATCAATAPISGV